ncbi:MAG: hypothetical protein NTY26_18020, partial [Burkholderiales bacterium]|nr:hypothetical protein [Burkholderiales bacterium]
LSANPALPWGQGLIQTYLDNWNWATLSSQAQLPWSTDFYQAFHAHWFAPLVSVHQSFDIQTLQSADIEALLQAQPNRTPA